VQRIGFEIQTMKKLNAEFPVETDLPFGVRRPPGRASKKPLKAVLANERPK
jgi:hypothetical protein